LDAVRQTGLVVDEGDSGVVVLKRA